MTPSMGQAAPNSPFGALADGPQGPSAAPDQTGDVLEQIRSVMADVADLGKTSPALAPDVQQIRLILRGMVVKIAQQASPSTAASNAVPMAGA